MIVASFFVSRNHPSAPAGTSWATVGSWAATTEYPRVKYTDWMVLDEAASYISLGLPNPYAGASDNSKEEWFKTSSASTEDIAEVQMTTAEEEGVVAVGAFARAHARGSRSFFN